MREERILIKLSTGDVQYFLVNHEKDIIVLEIYDQDGGDEYSVDPLIQAHLTREETDEFIEALKK